MVCADFRHSESPASSNLLLRPSFFDPAASNLILRPSLFDPAASSLLLRASFEPLNQNLHDLCSDETIVSSRRNHHCMIVRVLRTELLNAPKRRQELPREVQTGSRSCPDALRRRSGAAQRPPRSLRSCPVGPKSALEVAEKPPQL